MSTSFSIFVIVSACLSVYHLVLSISLSVNAFFYVFLMFYSVFTILSFFQSVVKAVALVLFYSSV